MNQFEHDQLLIMANAWILAAVTKPAEQAKTLNRCAEELRMWLRHADTAPGEPPDGEPFPLPKIAPLDALPRIEE